MNLTKALKLKKKLIKQVNEAYERFSNCNSLEKSEIDTSYNPQECYDDWIRLTMELVELKTKIHIANVSIADHIFRLGELKSIASKLKSLDTTSGIKRKRYGEGEQEYVCYIDFKRKDELIQHYEDEIERIQTEIETFNAKTKL